MGCKNINGLERAGIIYEKEDHCSRLLAVVLIVGAVLLSVVVAALVVAL